MCLECCMISFNAYLIAYICIYFISAAFKTVIERVNINYLEKYGKKVPATFQGVIYEEELNKIIQYTSDNVRFKLVQTIVIKSLFLFIVISGILPWLADYLANTNFLLAGLVFFSFFGLIEGVSGLSHELYHCSVL